MAGAGVRPPLATKPIRTLLAWQAAATLLLALGGGLGWGRDGAMSAALGGGVVLVANFVYALMGGIVRATSIFGALFVIFRAEAFKVALIFVGLLLVLTQVPGLVHAVFIVAFIVTTLLFGIALRTRD